MKLFILFNPPPLIRHRWIFPCDHSVCGYRIFVDKSPFHINRKPMDEPLLSKTTPKRLSWLTIITLNLPWFSIYFHSTILSLIIIPNQVATYSGKNAKGVGFGIVSITYYDSQHKLHFHFIFFLLFDFGNLHHDVVFRNIISLFVIHSNTSNKDIGYYGCFFNGCISRTIDRPSLGQDQHSTGTFQIPIFTLSIEKTKFSFKKGKT